MPALDQPWAISALHSFGEYGALDAFATRKTLGGICAAVPEGLMVEIGAGIGYLGSFLPDAEGLQARYIQTDIGPKNCHIAAEANPNVRTVCAAAQELPLQNEAATLVIGRSILDVTRTDEVAHEIARVLVPGGQFVHMRHTQPNLEWLVHSYPKPPSTRFVPYFGEKGNLACYKIVEEKVLRRHLRRNSLPETFYDPNLHVAIDHDPELKRLMQLHVKDLPTVGDTPPLEAMMDEIVGRVLAQAGLETTFAIATSEHVVPLKEARRAGLGAGLNYWRNNAGLLDARYEPTVPKGMAHIEGSIALTIASKSENADSRS